METIRISYDPSIVTRAMADAFYAAFAQLNREVVFVARTALENPLRVLAHKLPRERDYVFAPQPALAADIDPAPRAADIRYAGRLSDPVKIKDAWHGLSGRIYELCLNVTEALDAEASPPGFEQAVDAALLDMGCLSELPSAQYQYLTAQIDAYRSARSGFYMLKELLDAGVKVAYAGAQAYCSLYRHPNLIIEKQPCPAGIVVCPHPFLAYGAFPPLLSAMGGGSVAASDANGFMKDHFPEMIAYGDGDFAERVIRLLSRPDELAALGDLARQKVFNAHMPVNRAARILMALNLSGRNEVSLYEN